MNYDMLPVLITLTIKSSVILLIAFIAVGLIKRFSASERHLIWCLVFFSLSLLPILTFIVPSYQLPDSMFAFMMPLEVDIPGMETGTSIIDDRSITNSGSSYFSVFIENIKEINPGITATVIYMIVASLFLICLVFTFLRITLSIRSFPELHNSDIRALAQESKQQLGINRYIRLYSSKVDKTPWTWGVLIPKIILPENFHTWSVEDQRNALIHEISHIQRLDLASFILIRICCCIYWFHPLVWLAYRNMLIEAEKACDDRVLLNGSKPSVYASQLMEVANSIYKSNSQSLLVTSMARTSLLSQRIRCILDTDMRRSLIKGNTFKLTFFLAFIFSIPLVAINADEETFSQSIEGQDKKASTDDPGNNTYAVRKMIYEKLTQAQKLIEAKNYDEGLVILKELQANAGLSTYESAQVYNYIAYTYFILERYEEAILTYENILKQDGVPEILNLNSIKTLAKLYYIKGDYPRSIEYFNQWIAKTNEPTEDAHLVIGQAYFQMQQYKEALPSLTKAYNLIKEKGVTPDENMLLMIQSTYANLDDVDNAEIINAELEELYPNHDDNIDHGLKDSGYSSSDYLPIFKVQPIYPPDALSKKIEGYVIVEFTVTTEGTTKDIFVAEAKPEDIFNESALNTAATFKYKPRIVDGLPVEVEGVQNKITFSIEKEDG